ncbi:MAG: CPBP family intramembrane metalloprotease [Acidobacteria bacterium]|nr:CPBP family intramembrane metalloprotease [Acidobacteriota bacterium]MBI3486848.1 CPBP family intramembrane metalloprotease [Acidobacteriota bacterium]
MGLWTALCALSFLAFEASLMYVAERTVGLPSLPDPVFSTGLGPLLGAPLSEEILFRGYGLARIRELGGRRRALFLTALVFSLLHGHWFRLPGTFLLGLFFGWLVLRTGSLWPAFIGHFTVNGTVSAWTSLSVPSFDRAMTVPWWVMVSLGCTGLAGLILLGSPLVRRRIKGFS